MPLHNIWPLLASMRFVKNPENTLEAVFVYSEYSSIHQLANKNCLSLLLRISLFLIFTKTSPNVKGMTLSRQEQNIITVCIGMFDIFDVHSSQSET